MYAPLIDHSLLYSRYYPFNYSPIVEGYKYHNIVVINAIAESAANRKMYGAYMNLYYNSSHVKLTALSIALRRPGTEVKYDGHVPTSHTLSASAPVEKSKHALTLPVTTILTNDHFQTFTIIFYYYYYFIDHSLLPSRSLTCIMLILFV